jgi:integrase
VRARLDELRRQLAAGLPGVASTVTLGAFLDRYLADRAPTLADSSRATYARVAARITAALGGYRLTDLRPAHVQAFYTAEARRYAPRTVRLTHALLHEALATACRWQLCATNPAAGAVLPRIDQRRPAWLPADAAARFLAAAEAAADRRTALWAVLLTTGLRRGEALGLRWQDVDLAGGRIVVRGQLRRAAAGGLVWTATKTGQGRTVPLVEPAARLLRAWQARQAAERARVGAAWPAEGWVFTRPDGQPMHPTAVSMAIGPALARAGLPPVRLHDLRHSFASIMLREQVPLKVVSELLGHRTTRITADLYSHVVPELLDVAGAAIAAAFQRPPDPAP